MTDIKYQAGELLEVLLSSDCSCEEYDDVTDQSYPADYCVGCYEDGKFQVEAMLFEWGERTGFYGEYLETTSTHENWNGISLKRVVHVSELIQSLELRGDYTLYFRLDNDELTIRRTSHDEPVGASFLVKPFYIEGESDERD
jgi:hypothetical protein